MFIYLKSPIVHVVDHVAAAVGKAWEGTLRDNTSAKDQEEVEFLEIAYQYLSQREKAVYKLERTQHLRNVQANYRAPPSADELYSQPDEPNFALYLAGVLIGAAFIAGVIVASVWLAILISQNINQIIREITNFIISGQALVLVFSSILPVLISSLLAPLIGRGLEYVFAGIGTMDWLAFRTESSEKIASERAQIMSMIGASSGEGAHERKLPDPDVSKAAEARVPLQPGITEYVFKTNRVTIDDLGNDFGQTQRQHTIVFWIAFAAFILCLLGGAAAAFAFNQDIKPVGALGALCGIIGTFSYKMLGRARCARITLALFNSQVIELHERMEALKSIDDVQKRLKLEAAAWINFRVGMNKLYALEERSRGRKRL